MIFVGGNGSYFDVFGATRPSTNYSIQMGLPYNSNNFWTMEFPMEVYAGWMDHGRDIGQSI